MRKMFKDRYCYCTFVETNYNCKIIWLTKIGMLPQGQKIVSQYFTYSAKYLRILSLCINNLGRTIYLNLDVAANMSKSKVHFVGK